MATIRHPITQRQHALAARTIIGRSRRCDLSVDDAAVSGEHLAIWWSDGAWHVRDLGSTNGTLRNGVRLDPGQTEALEVGDVITTGRSDHSWIIEDLDPPVAFAVDPATGQRVLATDDVLALPDAAHPEVLISLGGADGWIAESSEGVRAVADQQPIQAGGRLWRVHLPVEHRGTVDASLTTASGVRGGLVFRVSQDEEYVELQLRRGAQTVELGARSHHYLLLLLARQRLKDAAAAEGPDTGQGWLHTEELMAMLAVPETHLNVQIFRARKQFLKAGCGSELVPVERRPGAGLLRIGTDRLAIEAI